MRVRLLQLLLLGIISSIACRVNGPTVFMKYDVFRENGKYGIQSLQMKFNAKTKTYQTTKRKIILEATYDSIYDLKTSPWAEYESTSIYVIQKNKKYGLYALGNGGKLLVPLIYDTIIPNSYMPLVKQGDKYGVLKSLSGNTTAENIPCIYDSIIPGGANSHDFYVKKGTDFSRLDEYNRVFQSVSSAGLQYINYTVFATDLLVLAKSDTAYHLLSSQPYFPKTYKADTSYFIYQQVVAEQKNKLGFVMSAQNGIAFVHDSIQTIDNPDCFSVFGFEQCKTKGIDCYCNVAGYKTYSNGKAGFVFQNQQTIPERYDDLFFLGTNGNCVGAIQNGKRGVLNTRTGETIVPLVYDSVHTLWVSFEHGTAHSPPNQFVVFLNGKCGIYSNGKLTTPMDYDDIVRLNQFRGNEGETRTILEVIVNGKQERIISSE